VFSIDRVVGSTGAFCMFYVFLGTYVLSGRCKGTSSVA